MPVSVSLLSLCESDFNPLSARSPFSAAGPQPRLTQAESREASVGENEGGGVGVAES